jgi:hypothetical protein
VNRNVLCALFLDVLANAISKRDMEKSGCQKVSRRIIKPVTYQSLKTTVFEQQTDWIIPYYSPSSVCTFSHGQFYGDGNYV